MDDGGMIREMNWRNFGRNVQESEKGAQDLATRVIFSLCAGSGEADWGWERANEILAVCDLVNRFAWSEVVTVDCGSRSRLCCPSHRSRRLSFEDRVR